MKVDLVTDSRLVDIVLQGFDAGIRVAESVPADMVAVPLGFSLDFSVVGSPAYLAENPAPQTPVRPSPTSLHPCPMGRRRHLSLGIRAG